MTCLGTFRDEGGSVPIGEIYDIVIVDPGGEAGKTEDELVLDAVLGGRDEAGDVTAEDLALLTWCFSPEGYSICLEEGPPETAPTPTLSDEGTSVVDPLVAGEPFFPMSCSGPALILSGCEGPGGVDRGLTGLGVPGADALEATPIAPVPLPGSLGALLIALAVMTALARVAASRGGDAGPKHASRVPADPVPHRRKPGRGGPS